MSDDVPANAIKLSWEDVHQLTVQLGDMIAADCEASGQRFDAMVVVPRGSYYPANILARSFGFNATNLLHACISSYDTPGSRNEFRLGQMPAREHIAGKDLLIIEEVCDTGHTLHFLIDYLREQGAASVKVGTLHYKPAQTQTGVVPDWFAAQTDEWIVYPWEQHDLATHQLFASNN